MVTCHITGQWNALLWSVYLYKSIFSRFVTGAFHCRCWACSLIPPSAIKPAPFRLDKGDTFLQWKLPPDRQHLRRRNLLSMNKTSCSIPPSMGTEEGTGREGGSNSHKKLLTRLQGQSAWRDVSWFFRVPSVTFCTESCCLNNILAAKGFRAVETEQVGKQLRALAAISDLKKYY